MTPLADEQQSSGMVERVARAINRARLDPCVSAQAVAALEASHHAELVEALRTLLDEARERGGTVTDGEHLGCLALRNAGILRDAERRG